MLHAPDANKLLGLRDRALLAVLLACGLRRHEAAQLTSSHLQQRENHWAIVDLKGKAGHMRTVPIPDWVKGVLDEWRFAAGITTGRIFRRVNKARRTWGETVTEKVVWHVVREFAKKAGIDRLAPHDLRRTCARLFTPLWENWSRSSFCWVTSRSRRRSDILAANSDPFRRQRSNWYRAERLMSSRIMEGLPTIRSGS